MAGIPYDDHEPPDSTNRSCPIDVEITWTASAPEERGAFSRG